MSRKHRALLAAPVSAVSVGTLTLIFTFTLTLTLSLQAPVFAGGNTAAPTEYVVKNGDFLAGIAAKVGVSLPQLLSANHLTKTSLILPGQKLVIPASATPPVVTAAPAAPVAGGIVHTVKSGDFLLGIATLYKVTLADLLAVNHITVKSVISPGRQLALPANATAPQVKTSVTSAATLPTAAGVAYTVKSGDFLAGIASNFKVKLSDLLAVNKLKPSSLILPGTQLAMPAGAVQPAPTPAAAPAPAAVESSGGPAAAVVAYAYAQLGKPYRFFTAGPNTFDCSGLVKAAYAQIGIELIHHSASQATYGTAVDIWSESIKPGDLVFMATHGTPEINHVGIAVDATHWIHAPKPGDVVRLAPIPPKGILIAVRRLIA
jgi:LysM repeat protein